MFSHHKGVLSFLLFFFILYHHTQLVSVFFFCLSILRQSPQAYVARIPWVLVFFAGCFGIGQPVLPRVPCHRVDCPIDRSLVHHLSCLNLRLEREGKGWALYCVCISRRGCECSQCQSSSPPMPMQAACHRDWIRRFLSAMPTARRFEYTRILLHPINSQAHLHHPLRSNCVVVGSCQCEYISETTGSTIRTLRWD